MGFDDLYQEIILDHYRNPRNSADLDYISEDNVHENPACGDSLKLHAKINDSGVIEQVLFDGSGCAISVASASMMTELLQGKTITEAQEMVVTFQKVMRGEEDPDQLTAWGDIVALQGVISFPLRVKCATLSWHALAEAIKST